MFRRKLGTSSARHSVSDDWFSALPRDKSHLFDAIVQHWESSYAMMSVALDEAISLRTRGQLVCARQFVGMSADLLGQLADTLVAGCRTVSNHGRRVVDLPSVHPLRTEFFRGETARAAAVWSDVLHRVIFVDRTRFFQKVRILSETLENLSREFEAAADDVFAGTSVKPGESWDALECLHYDFNTCLRESEVMLKSFLRVLPAEQLTAFSADLSTIPANRRSKGRSATRPGDICASA
ncbi:MAG: hypothetical protein WB630_21350 [Candidatus Acidiferrales bacterium]